MTIRFAILGDARIIDPAGRELSAPTRKPLALLSYLLLGGSQGQSREALTALLWGGRFDSQARQSLRQALYSLRRLLGDENEQIIGLRGSEVVIDRDLVEVDAWTFEKLAASRTEADLAQALSLYRGPLLSGLNVREPPFQEWYGRQRKHFEELAWTARYWLAKAMKARGAHDEALSTAVRLLEADPVREKSHRLIMQIHAKSGDRGAALRQFQQCATLLKQHLGIDPSTETLRLLEQIKAAEDIADEEDELIAATIAATAIVSRASGSGAKTAAAHAPAEAPGRQHTFFCGDRPTVAVLGLANLGSDVAHDHFAEALTGDLVAALASWRWFPVVNPTTGRPGDADIDGPAAAARAADARYALHGTVRRGGDRVRVTAQLIDAVAGHVLWSDRYDRDIDDLFAVQDELTEKIVTSVEPELGRAEQERAQRKPEGELTAWDHVMRANALKSDLAALRNAEAIAHLRKAIEIDPALSYAWSNLAQCLWFEGILGWTKTPEASFRESDESAQRALELDDADWLAHTMLGLCDMWNRQDHDRSLQRLKKAVTLNPNASVAHHSAACVYEYAGQPERALPHLRAVMRIDPNYPNNAALLADFALTYLQLEQLEDSVASARKAVAMKPGYARVYHRLAAALGLLGRIDEAAEALARIYELQPGFSADYVRQTYPFRDAFHLDLLLQGLRAAGLRR